ncbi:MAG: hypothetical protein QMC95_12115 [Desulfitobacteriaceae bacterium]|nr:hypothetical protein [Desulfitobacteriaceae bacterium]MDI6879183.1 hypothetical protein [Desulfitobacteriaceae bacterium]MDI6914952.1 hypothetical protein [Desulfitobacteriaceae bacterium]
MENEKFQELMVDQFAKMFKAVTDIQEKLGTHDQRFDKLDKLADQHHEELEKVARQVEKLVVGQESLEDDMDYLLRRSLRKKIE